MNIDVTNCTKVNIIDCCSVWNILSSRLFYSTIVEEKFSFSITNFVEYECLHKIRRSVRPAESEIQDRLRKEKGIGRFSAFQVSIEDLQDQDILELRNSLGIGEVSSIVFAKKTNQVFLTDDQGARTAAQLILGPTKVQTTPHLLGWLFFKGILNDGALEAIVDEHIYFERPLRKFFRQVFDEAMRLRLLSQPKLL